MCGGSSGRGVRTEAGAKCVSDCAVWLLAPVRERMGGERLCPSTRTPWAASRAASTVMGWLLPDVLVRVGSSRHSRRSLWRGCGCIRSSLAAVPACSASRSVRRPPVGDSIAPAVARHCPQHSQRFSFLTNDGFCTRFAVPAEPPLLSPTRARRCPPASAACATRSPAVRRAFSPSNASATSARRNSSKRCAA